MKRNRFDNGGTTKKNNFKSGAGMSEKAAYAAWRKANPDARQGAAGLIQFDNSLPEGHPFKDKKKTTGRYKDHPIGKLLKS